MEEFDQFTKLENSTIGRNLYRARKIRDKKALEVAKFVGLTESAYTKYERGESKITIELIQKVAEFLKFDPLQLLTVSPGNFIENVSNAVVLSNFQTFQTVNETQNEMMLKLIENVMLMNERLIKLLEGKSVK
jgi:transcriptional regulator with XRE-family HTH domain